MVFGIIVAMVSKLGVKEVILVRGIALGTKGIYRLQRWKSRITRLKSKNFLYLLNQ